MSKNYYVIDTETYYTSFNEEADAPEVFDNVEAAVARASALAAEDTLTTYEVVTAVKRVSASPVKVKVSSVK